MSIAIAYTLISLIEYTAHRFLMHQPALARKFPRFPLLYKIFSDHAKVHHHDAYDIFNYEPNPRLRLYNLIIKYRNTVAIGLLFGLPLFLLDHITGFTFLIGMFVHNRIWTAVHIEMHVNEGHFIRRTPFFAYWEHYHFLHHLYPNKNYNALLPLWDLILGTSAKSSPADLEALEKTRRLESVSRRAVLRAKYSQQPPVTQ